MNWRVTILILIALLGGFAVLVAIVTRPIAAPHHEIYVNGNVLTMDSQNRIAEAVSVRDGVIEAVGGSEAIMWKLLAKFKERAPKTLEGLRDSGVLTAEEYEAKRAEVIARI